MDPDLMSSSCYRPALHQGSLSVELQQLELRQRGLALILVFGDAIESFLEALGNYIFIDLSFLGKATFDSGPIGLLHLVVVICLVEQVSFLFGFGQDQNTACYSVQAMHDPQVLLLLFKEKQAYYRVEVIATARVNWDAGWFVYNQELLLFQDYVQRHIDDWTLFSKSFVLQQVSVLYFILGSDCLLIDGDVAFLDRLKVVGPVVGLKLGGKDFDERAAQPPFFGVSSIGVGVGLDGAKDGSQSIRGWF